jgi:hypothetical protein
MELACGAGVDAFATFRIEEFGKAEDDAHEIERAALIVSLLHGRRDFVAGLGDDIFQTNCGGIVTPSAKRIKACHAEGLALFQW